MINTVSFENVNIFDRQKKALDAVDPSAVDFSAFFAMPTLRADTNAEPIPNETGRAATSSDNNSTVVDQGSTPAILTVASPATGATLRSFSPEPPSSSTTGDGTPRTSSFSIDITAKASVSVKGVQQGPVTLPAPDSAKEAVEPGPPQSEETSGLWAGFPPNPDTNRSPKPQTDFGLAVFGHRRPIVETDHSIAVAGSRRPISNSDIRIGCGNPTTRETPPASGIRNGDARFMPRTSTGLDQSTNVGSAANLSVQVKLSEFIQKQGWQTTGSSAILTNSEPRRISQPLSDPQLYVAPVVSPEENLSLSDEVPSSSAWTNSVDQEVNNYPRFATFNDLRTAIGNQPSQEQSRQIQTQPSAPTEDASEAHWPLSPRPETLTAAGNLQAPRPLSFSTNDEAPVRSTTSPNNSFADIRNSLGGPGQEPNTPSRAAATPTDTNRPESQQPLPFSQRTDGFLGTAGQRPSNLTPFTVEITTPQSKVSDAVAVVSAGSARSDLAAENAVSTKVANEPARLFANDAPKSASGTLSNVRHDQIEIAVDKTATIEVATDQVRLYTGDNPQTAAAFTIPKLFSSVDSTFTADRSPAGSLAEQGNDSPLTTKSTESNGPAQTMSSPLTNKVITSPATVATETRSARDWTAQSDEANKPDVAIDPQSKPLSTDRVPPVLTKPWVGTSVPKGIITRENPTEHKGTRAPFASATADQRTAVLNETATTEVAAKITPAFTDENLKFKEAVDISSKLRPQLEIADRAAPTAKKEDVQVKTDTPQSQTSPQTVNDDKKIEPVAYRPSETPDRAVTRPEATPAREIRETRSHDIAVNNRFDAFVESAVKADATPNIEKQIAEMSAKLSEQIEPKVMQLAFSAPLNGDKKMLKMRLNPAELGTLEITLEKSTSGRISAVFHTESPGTQQILNDGLAQLRSSLENSGCQIGNLTTSCGTMSTTGGEGREGRSERHGNDGGVANSGSDIETNSAKEDDLQNRLVNLRA